jgi:hypothetical protein
MKKATTIVTLFLVLFWIFQFSGCLALNGVQIPPYPDIREEDPELRTISDWNFASLKPGTTLRVLLFSGEERTGTFRGLVSISEPEYARKYGRSRELNHAAVELPVLGDRLLFVDTSDHSFQGEFVGFDEGFLIARLHKEQPPTRVNLRMLKEIASNNGQSFPPGPIISLVEKGRVPFRSAAALDTRMGMANLPLEEISFARIIEPPEKTARGIIKAAAVIGISLGFYFIILKPLLNY